MLLVAGLVAAAGVPGLAAQDLINIDFGAGPSTAKVGPAAYGQTATDFWNYYERKFVGGTFVGSGTVSGLRLSDGTGTAAWMAVENAPGAWGNDVADLMYGSYLYPFNGDPITVAFRDLPPGAYDLYLYGHGGPGIDAANSVFEVIRAGTSLGTKATTTGAGWNSVNWTDGQQYVRFPGVDVRVGQELAVRVMRGSHTEAYLNGMQLVRLGAIEGPPLSIMPSGGPFTNSVSVALFSALPDAEIRYTLDNSEPRVDSTRYRAAFEVTRTTTVKARLFVNTFPASEVVSATFVADPGLRFAPAAGLFTNRIDVTLSSRIAGARIHFTVDGSEPGPASTAYTEPLRLTAATTVRARAYLGAFPVTEVLVAAYVRVYAFDDDGIARDWRVTHFGAGYATDPRAGVDADPDGDETSNLQEYTAGTDPLNPLSGFRLGVRAVPELRFASRAGTTYRILRRTAIDGAAMVVAELRATGETTTWVDIEAGSEVNPSFYLVQPVP